MDDYTLGRVREVHGTQLNDLWLYEEQLSRWHKDSPTDRQRTDIERLTEQLTTLRQVFTLCLALSDEMNDGTIDKILAKDDVELAIEFLMGISESCHPAAHKKRFTHQTRSATLQP